MKHNLKILVIILIMFILTQFIGLYVVNHYSSDANPLPYGMEVQSPEQEMDYYGFFTQLIIAFLIAVAILFVLMKFQFQNILRIWFFIVVIIALAITFNALLPSFKYAYLVALIIAIPFAVLKIFGRDIIVHNFTELLIYPGIASIFVPILNVATAIVFLILISIYDMWAVWKTGFMQKMVKYHVDKAKVFSGFFLPYMSRKTKLRLKKRKNKLKQKKIRVNVAILGGGDVIFPIITSGVFLKTLGLIPALLVMLGAILGLVFLFLTGEKKKPYPAMPYITAGILIAIGFIYLIF